MKVLYVDDNPSLRKLAEFALKSYSNFDVQTLESAQQAIECAIEWQPDLIVADLYMPGMNGASLLAALKSNQRTGHIPVVFVSARSDQSIQDELLKSGALAILEKPFDPWSLGRDLAALMPAPLAPQTENTLEGKLAAIRMRFRGQAAEEAKLLMQDWSSDADDAVRLKQAMERAHSLSGSASTLGFMDLATSAQQLEHAIKGGCDADVAQPYIAELCDALRLIAA